MYGKESWASNPEIDGRLDYFENARVIAYADAGHWLQHDQRAAVVQDMELFLNPSIAPGCS